jgi:hypothetical protein
MIKEGAERRRIESLLPWYAAGTLSRSDAHARGLGDLAVADAHETAGQA